MPVSKINRPAPKHPPISLDPRAMITPQETATLLRVSPRTVYRMIERGQIPRDHYTYIGRKIFVLRGRLEELVANGGLPLEGAPQ